MRIVHNSGEPWTATGSNPDEHCDNNPYNAYSVEVGVSFMRVTASRSRAGMSFSSTDQGQLSTRSANTNGSETDRSSADFDLRRLRRKKRQNAEFPSTTRRSSSCSVIVDDHRSLSL